MLVFSSFVLGINTLFSVVGIFILRQKKLSIEGAYRTFAYPLAPVIYLMVTVWTLGYVLVSRQDDAWAGLGIIFLGGIIYGFSKNRDSEIV